MSDDFDDEETQHRLVIDDQESAENNNQNVGKSKDILKTDGSENGNNLNEVRDRNGKSNSSEPMDTSPAKPADHTDSVGNGHSADNPSSKHLNDLSVDTSKHSITDFDTESGHKVVSDKSLNNFLSPATKKRRKMTDKSTCVLTKSCQVEDSGSNLLSLKNGSTACINITIVCKSGSNAMFIVAKWRGREYHGVLTDGEHPVELHTTNVPKKHLSAEKSGDHFAGTVDSLGLLQAGKARGKRGGRVGDKKNRNHESHESDDGETGSKPGADEKLGLKLVEVLDKSYIRCPHGQCGFRFNRVDDLNTHMLFTHTEAKATLTESVATQTFNPLIDSATDNCANDVEFNGGTTEGTKVLCAKCKRADASPSVQSTTVASKTGHSVTIIEADQAGSVEDLFKAVRSPQSTNRSGGIGLERTGVSGSMEGAAKNDNIVKDGNTPSAFSDISDDGAPTLEKEESFDKRADASKKTDEPLNIIAQPTTTGMLGDDLTRPANSRQQTNDRSERVKTAPSPSSIKQDGTGGADANAALNTASPSSSAFSNLTAAQQQLMSGLMPSANMQQMAALLGAAGNSGGLPIVSSAAMYATPFQPNFQLNSSYFPMNISPAAAAVAQQFPVNAAAVGKVPPLVGFSPTAASFGVNPSSIAASFAAAASNGLNPAGSSPTTGHIAQQKSTNSDFISSQRHKIYELKSGSTTRQSNASAPQLLASPIADGPSKDSAADAVAGSAGRLSAIGHSAGGSDAPIPLRPSSSSALPSASSGQRNAFKRPPTNSPGCVTAAASSAQPFLSGLTSGMPPNLTASPLLNPSQLNPQLLFSPQQQQQIQQLNQFRQMGNFLTPEIAAQYAAMLGAPQMAAFAQQPQPTTQSQQQFPQPPHK